MYPIAYIHKKYVIVLSGRALNIFDESYYFPNLLTHHHTLITLLITQPVLSSLLHMKPVLSIL